MNSFAKQRSAFYILGYRRMGRAFTVKTFFAVTLLSGLSILIQRSVSFDYLNPVLGTILFDFLSGSALLAIFRNGASLEGIGILALIPQDKTGFRAEHTQLIFDLFLFTVALFVLEIRTVAISFRGSVIVNLVVVINHRRDWYIAT